MTDARPASCMRRRIDEGIAIPPTSSCYVPTCTLDDRWCERPDVPVNLQRPPEPPASWGKEPPFPPYYPDPILAVDRSIARMAALAGIELPPLDAGADRIAIVKGLVEDIERREQARRQLLIEQYEHLCEMCDRTPQAIGPDTTYEAIFGWFTVTVGLSMMPRTDADWTEPTESGKLHVPTLQHVLKVFEAVDGVTMPRSAMVAAIKSLLPSPPMSDDEFNGFLFWSSSRDGIDSAERVWHALQYETREVWIERAKRYEAARNAE